eukprot:12628625-Ditylum_brightwellii.AAC.1
METACIVVEVGQLRVGIVSNEDLSVGLVAKSFVGELTIGSGLETDRLGWLEPESCAGDRSVTREE